MKQIRLLALGLALLGFGAAQAVDASTVARTSQTKTNRITLPNGRQVFVSGMNLAWINFGADVGDAALDTNSFKQAIQDVRDSGGNAMRVWLSTNGANDPKFDATTGLASGLGSKTIGNVKAMLSIANRNGVVLVLDLLSHNLMAAGQVGSWNQMSIANNAKLLKTDAGIAAYVQNAVVPLVTAIGKDTGILAWEVFNEPEGMLAANATNWGLVDSGIQMANIQKVINRVAGAIHRAVPGILVSNGAVQMSYTSSVAGTNYYSDSALIATGSDSDGVLDFYMVHYYGWNGTSNSPFTKDYAHWKLDKPLVVGEFPAGDWSPTISSKNQDAAKQDTLLTYLHNTGYAGGLSWCYFGDGTDKWLGSITTAGAGLKAAFALDSAAIKIRDVVRVKKTGNGVLAVNIDNDNAKIYPALKFVTSKDFSKDTVFAFDLLVPSSATGGIKVSPVFQTTSAWTWNSSGTYCTPTGDSTWMTCSAKLSKFATPSELGSIMSIMFQFIANPTFHGQVWFDNIRIDHDTLWNFNDGKVVFGADTYDTAQAARITGLDVLFPESISSGTGILASKHISIAAFAVSRTGTSATWSRAQPLTDAATLRVLDAQGRTLARSSVAAGATSGMVPSVAGSGLRWIILEGKGVQESALLPSVR